MASPAVIWIGRNVDDLNWGTFKQHATDCALTPGFPGRAVYEFLKRK
jgi:hypothetical protein